MIAIVDYKAGNLTSVKRALSHIGVDSVVTPDPAQLAAADRIIFPGVGHAGSAMQTLRERGLDAALRDAFQRGTPILGICIGAQIILDRSEEADTACLGLIPGECVGFRMQDPALKVPHMGWNAIRIRRAHPILAGVTAEEEFYFVHSFFPKPAREDAVFAECEYGGSFPAMIGRDSLIAAQFHLEKSGEAGLRILKNFCGWNGKV